ncbi:hypothetical protein Tcan_18624 [Toxocara canis]|uniref:Uncharacterized protein n=1 Tax=Toxocara canis TaxID=6265 RepID=A0A0B2US61_TOXCA|nr:hypothetical protein Tcan_18624 [Toxocara canis]
MKSTNILVVCFTKSDDRYYLGQKTRANASPKPLIAQNFRLYHKVGEESTSGLSIIKKLTESDLAYPLTHIDDTLANVFTSVFELFVDEASTIQASNGCVAGEASVFPQLLADDHP